MLAMPGREHIYRVVRGISPQRGRARVYQGTDYHNHRRRIAGSILKKHCFFGWWVPASPCLRVFRETIWDQDPKFGPPPPGPPVSGNPLGCFQRKATKSIGAIGFSTGSKRGSCSASETGARRFCKIHCGGKKGIALCP